MLAQYDGLVEGYLAAAEASRQRGDTGRLWLSAEDLLFLHSNGGCCLGRRPASWQGHPVVWKVAHLQHHSQRHCQQGQHPWFRRQAANSET
jgi:hypothetical protein